MDRRTVVGAKLIHIGSGAKATTIAFNDVDRIMVNWAEGGDLGGKNTGDDVVSWPVSVFKMASSVKDNELVAELVKCMH